MVWRWICIKRPGPREVSWERELRMLSELPTAVETLVVVWAEETVWRASCLRMVRQSLEQPMSAAVSHFSGPTMKPSPQTEAQTMGLLKPPPVHFQPSIGPDMHPCWHP